MPHIKDRYNKTHEYKGIKFDLSDYTPDEEECRIIILKIIEQASRDYLALYQSKTTALQHNWETAKDFIFRENYPVNWGGRIITSAQLLELVDIDIDWLRRKMRERFAKIERENDV
jgi:hypothetical protein